MTPEQHEDVDRALLAYWTARDEAALAQAARGVSDTGARATATSGGHLDRIAQLFARVCRAAGVPETEVAYKAPAGDPYKRASQTSGCVLPGYYRPTKNWDVVVWADGQPIVAIELKSQNGPSYGNNANNRAEEALGNADDLRRAQEAGLLHDDVWLGYAYVMEMDEESTLERGYNDAGWLPKDDEFKTWSYVSRVGSLARRMVEDNRYHAAWPVATSRPNCPDARRKSGGERKCPQHLRGTGRCRHTFDWSEISPIVNGYSHFIEGLTAQLALYYEPPRPGGDPTATTQLF